MRDKFKDIVADTDGDYEAIAEHYMEIYAGTSLTEDQVWEEMICDSLADMNIFSKSKSRAEAAEVMSTAIPAIQQAVSETKTEAKVVWRLLFALKGERRTMRCTPFSLLRYP